MNNPFTISFGMLPRQVISRPVQTNEILDAFTAEIPSVHVFMITGVRGSGKTVLLTDVTKRIRQSEQWIAVELSPERDILSALAAKLYSMSWLTPLFAAAKISVSVLGIGFSFDNQPVYDSEVVVEKMLSVLKKHHKRLLITIDEAVNNKYIRVFAHSFQMMLRADYDVYLIMTGLYENIYELQNEKTLTFLYRAPKIMLGALNIDAVMNTYARIFSLGIEKAAAMAWITRGYAFAFQVLGYLQWEHKEYSLEELLPEYDQYLAEYVYEKIWHELSEKERMIVVGIPDDKDIRVQELRKNQDMESGAFSVYREKLIRKGIVEASRYGYLTFLLPRFGVFAKRRRLFEDM